VAKLLVRAQALCWVGIGARAWLQEDQLRLIMALREEAVEERVCCDGGRAATVAVQTQTPSTGRCQRWRSRSPKTSEEPITKTITTAPVIERLL
jgi:hypothetical protein